MAARKTINFLPTVFQTDVNQKFLSATMDQLIAEPNLRNIYGYIGRTFAPTFKSKDSYIIESSAERQKYQLEPSIVVRNEQNDITFFASYIDILNKVKYYGGLTNDHSRLFDNEYYSFDPRISLDKFVNFSQYYWLPNGPDAVDVNTAGVEFKRTFTVARNVNSKRYDFTTGGAKNNTITLARGGQYKFVVDQPGNPFWIQTELGIDGLVNATPTVSSRDVLGVTNNGTDSGTITFIVPQSDSQDRFTSMQNVFNVDYATPTAYADLHNQLLSNFLDKFPQYVGITGQLDGKYLIFVNPEVNSNRGEEAWTAQGIYDISGVEYEAFDAGTVVPEEQRYGVWRVQFVNNINNDPIIKLVFVQNVNLNEKVYVKYGLVNANKSFYKDYDGFFYTVPVISSVQNTMYLQDGTNSEIYATINLVEASGWAINVEQDILGKSTYTSPNGVAFTSGLKIRFGSDVTPDQYQGKEYYVENVGDAIKLVDVNLLVTPELYNDELATNYPGEVFPEYITINRCSQDLNAWSRNNRWFHRDVITATAAYNEVDVAFDQKLRAQRPIVQFSADLQLFNSGRIGKAFIDILDVTTTDAFTQLNGKIIVDGGLSTDSNGNVYVNGEFISNDFNNFALKSTGSSKFGIELFDGLRVLFANDIDPLVRDKIYVINLVQTKVDAEGVKSGPYSINLTLAPDGDSDTYDSVVVTNGDYKGSQWWYDGIKWNESQQKTQLQQEPLFDVLDNAGNSFSTYSRSTFTGTKLFGYNRTGAVYDSVLGFNLKYRSFQAQGDIEFTNYFDTETFTYVENQTVKTVKVSSGFLQKIIDRTTTVPRNNWNTVVESSKQYQLITYIYNELNSPFLLDVIKADEVAVPYIKVYLNNAYLKPTDWSITDNRVTVLTQMYGGDKVDILIYSKTPSQLGQYQIPLNLDLNAQNTDLSSLTLGQVRNHLVELSQNSTDLEGDILGQSNLRDIELTAQGGNILQHSAPISYSALFLLDDNVNFIDASRYAQREYARFKNKFLELSASLTGIDALDPISSVDLILKNINAIKNKTFPWYHSDMVPYGTLKNTITRIIFDPLVRSYEITKVFDAYSLSNQAVLVYLNDVQLLLDTDYSFDTDRPAITIADSVELKIDDVLKFVEYQDTNGNYIPETPTKLGLYPRFIPEIFLDDTYREPINVIRGHDGSITPAFDDYRDSFLLELERRIYNNIKLADVGSYQDIYQVVPGKFRNSDYSITEVNQILSRGFLTWLGNNKIDFATNDTFNSNDPFTWNYGRFIDRVDGEALPGSWKACYQYFYDTIRPHQTPWEMLGFTAQPDWWLEFYGPGPYTGGNKLLWDDLEAGIIRGGFRAGVDEQFARPGLSQFIPVDENGYLLNPAQILTATFDSSRAATAWDIGQYGPVEYAWRTSSDFPFAVQQALALAKPGKYFGLLADTSTYWLRFYSVNQYLTDDNDHVTQTALTFNGDTSSVTLVRTAGYLNWIADYLVSQGIDPASKITPMLKNYEVNLAYKMAGFSDQRYLQVLAEQSSPTSTNDSIIIPNENYSVHLYKSTPVQKMVYSGVIVEKTTNGFSVRGYNLSNPYFTIIPSIVNANGYKVTVLNGSATIYRDYQALKLTVPYGYEFNNQQQLADFLISYERFLMGQGFTFTDTDEQLGELRNFKLSVKEFLFWAQQGWKTGSILVLSPVASVISAVSIGAITDEITDSQYGSKVLDQNFNLIKNVNYTVLRTPTSLKISLTNDAVIGLVELNLVQYEHVLVFDNTTVFNDIIYKPELGNRQYRLKLIGQKTAAWDGSLSAPGFIYNSSSVKNWTAGKDYLKGDLVEYKDQLYVALQNVVATSEFEFDSWKRLNSNELKTGLLPNLSTIAVKSQAYYDSHTTFRDSNQIEYSHGLIGFKPRQYLTDLGLDTTTQIELYKGFIKQKGSSNAVTQLTKAEFNNLSSQIEFFEEWAIRVGEYGALDTNPYVEIALDEKAFGVNPAVAEFVGSDRNSDANGVTVFNKAQLYKSTEQFSGTIALNRDDHSDYDSDIPTAGYVNADDVDATIYDIANYQDLNIDIYVIGSGYTIWCAKDFNQEWNVYRVTETANHVTSVSNALDGYITFVTDEPHNLSAYDVFMVRNLDEAYDGFYQVERVNDLYTITVKYQYDTTQLTTIEGYGILFVLNSLRFDFMETARNYMPLHGWHAGEKIWIDTDAETTSVQGQPYSPSNTWKVYEKTMPWDVKQNLAKGSSEVVSSEGFGTSVRLSADGLIAVTGAPQLSMKTIDLSTVITANAGSYITQATSGANLTLMNNITGTASIVAKYNTATAIDLVGNLYINGVNTGSHPTTITSKTGIVNTFLKDSNGVFAESFIVAPDGNNTLEFGTSVDLATDALAAGAPGSNSNKGYVYVYNKAPATTTYFRSQILVGNLSATGDRFGSSVSFDETGTWLYVGAPGNDRVYVYGLNKNITPRQQVTSINNQNRITLSSNITAYVGNRISQPGTGAEVIVLANVINGNVVTVSSLTNIVTGNVSLTFNVNTVNSVGDAIATTVTTAYPVSLATTPVTNTISLSFTPDVANDANSLLVTSKNQTYIPGIDYTLSGTTLTFASTVSQNDISIVQQPYYTLVTTLQGNVGSNFGSALDSSWDGAQLGVGAPKDTVDGLAEAGSVWVYDRIIEAFDSTGTQDYTTLHAIGAVRRVTIDNVEVTNYQVIGSNTIRFITPPDIGKIVYIETNQFNLLELLLGSVVQKGARFGTALTICSNNCAIYVGAPYYDNGTQYNAGAVFKFHNRGRLYGTNIGVTKNPVFTPGDSIRLDNFEVVMQPLHTNPTTGLVMSPLDSLVYDINNAGILGVTAVNEGGYLRLNSDKTVAKNRLRILSGSPAGNDVGIYAAAGLKVFAEMQIIINPFNASGEYFGTKVILASNAYMLVISSEAGTTRNFTTFDDITTTFDSETTNLYDVIKGSGSVYIYELYDDPRDAVENPGRYAYCQQLNPGDLNYADRFGAAIDIVGSTIIASAPSDDTALSNAGSVYTFENPTRTRGWNLIRWQQPMVDIDSINRIYLYNKSSNTILSTLEFIDPAKGKILGEAEQEISYKTGYDPAVYNRGNNTNVSLNTNLYWDGNQVGEVWWNLSQVRYLDYEQGSLTYRSINWGRLFPGSTIEVLEWVESDVLPSKYVDAGYDGVPKYIDDSAYVEVTYVDPVTNIITSKFYFWVKDKTSVDPNNETRNIPILSIQDMIENPKNQGVPYAAVVKDNAFIVYNVGEYLSASDTILHFDYDLIKNTSIIHSEYELIQKGNQYSKISPKIVNKLLDSLSGLDTVGAVVPDPKLSVADRYGISTRPRQSMFIDRLAALTNLVEYVNSILIQKPIARQYDMTKFNSAEPVPLSKEQSAEIGVWDLSIATETYLSYIDTAQLDVGYKVLVETDTTQDNLWVIYELVEGKTWEVYRVQSYKTDLYWDYVDWFAEGYSLADKIDYATDTLVDALKLPRFAGEEILVRVTNSDAGGWSLITVNASLEFVVVGIQNGTIQLKNSISNFADTELGFGNQGYSSNRYDQNPNIEIRNIIESLRDDIFINELGAEFNNLFFVMINYLFNEQKYVDWIFKTSFISVTHQLRSLLQSPNYIKDNQTYYRDYINEVKPYATKIREYLINYNSSDEFAGYVSDFDLPAYYDTDMNVFRSPSGENIVKDSSLWTSADYAQWYVHRNHIVESIIVENGGSGYTSEPTVTIVGGSGITGGNADIVATARAIINYDTGAVTSIVVTKHGKGYESTPNVIINGNCTTPATAYAVLKNNRVRSFDSTLKFDRVGYTSAVKEWQPNTSYIETVFDETGRWIFGDIISHKTLAGRYAYTVNANIVTGNSFVSTDYTVYNASRFTNANDRIVGYYEPLSGMPARDLNQLVSGIEYPGVSVQGVGFAQQPGFSGKTLVKLTFDTPVNAPTGSIVTQPGPDALLNLSGSITVTAGDYITQPGTTSKPNVAVYDSGIYDTVSNTTQVYVTYVNNKAFDLTGNLTVGNIYVNGTAQKIATYNVDNAIWSNVGILPTSIDPVTDANVKVTDGGTSVISVTGTLNSTARFNSTVGNIKINGTWVTATVSEMEFVNTLDSTYSGQIEVESQFDTGMFDNIAYDEDGNPMLDEATVDTIIRSAYTDVSLGQRAEDIDVDGGAYVDRYSSHAPEELIPGVVFDTLDMQVYTQINGGADVLGYRIFNNMLRETTYLRIADDYTTTLAQDLLITDSEIVVANASKLIVPNPIGNIPGVVFINGERITYYTIDMLTNTLGQIRRGTQGTSAQIIHQAGAIVSDASITQIIPGTVAGNVTLSADTAYSVTDAPTYRLKLVGTVSANVGDIITQPTSSVNASVIGIDTIDSEYLWVAYNNSADFDYAVIEVQMSGNVSLNAGDIVTQASTGANLRVRSTVINSNSAQLLYIDMPTLVSNSAIKINNVATSILPEEIVIQPSVGTELYINGVVSEAYPLGELLVGGATGRKTTADGTVTIIANTTLQTANVWYNWAVSTTDGSGFEGSITEPVLFLKDKVATNTVVGAVKDMIVTEDTVNTLTTEDGQTILED